MSEDKRRRPEATTAAQWWSKYLRDVAIALSPVSRLMDEGVIASDSEFEQIVSRARYHFALKALNSLTEENILAFESNLAEVIDAEMEADPYSVCHIIEGDKYHIGPELGTALVAAGIETDLFATEPIFRYGMSTLCTPGRILACDGQGSLFELEIIVP
jgi:hypothetical protein